MKTTLLLPLLLTLAGCGVEVSDTATDILNCSPTAAQEGIQESLDAVRPLTIIVNTSGYFASHYSRELNVGYISVSNIDQTATDMILLLVEASEQQPKTR